MKKMVDLPHLGQQGLHQTKMNPRQMSEIGRTMHFDRHHINEIHSNCRAQLAGMGAQIKIELR